MRRRAVATVLTYAIACGLVAGAARAAVPSTLPAAGAQVTDLAGLLEPERAARLEEQLARVRADGGPDLRVLTLPTLAGEDNLEDYSVRVAHGWGIGDAERDDGALLVVVSDDRRLRLEVGYGLEATLTDLEAAHLLDEVMVPRLRAGQPGAAIEEGVLATLRVLGVEPPVSRAVPGEAPGTAVKVATGVLFGAILLLITLRLVCAQGVSPWFVFPLFVLPFWALPALAVAEGSRARLAFVLAAMVAALFAAARLWVRATRAGRSWARNSRFGHALGADREAEPTAVAESGRTASDERGWSTSSSSSGGDFGGGGASSRW